MADFSSKGDSCCPQWSCPSWLYLSRTSRTTSCPPCRKLRHLETHPNHHVRIVTSFAKGWNAFSVCKGQFGFLFVAKRDDKTTLSSVDHLCACAVGMRSPHAHCESTVCGELCEVMKELARIVRLSTVCRTSEQSWSTALGLSDEFMFLTEREESGVHQPYDARERMRRQPKAPFKVGSIAGR